MTEQEKEALRAMNIDQLKYLIVVEMYRTDPSYHHTDDIDWVVEELIGKVTNL